MSAARISRLSLPAIAVFALALLASPVLAQFDDERSLFGEGLQEEEGLEEDNWLNDSFGSFPGATGNDGETGFGEEEEDDLGSFERGGAEEGEFD